MEIKRCAWAGTEPLYVAYHDLEWGVPVHDDQRLFEFLTLEGAQAGLSWSTILNKRENYRLAFNDFNPAMVAHYDERRIGILLQNPGIVRNRLKIQAAVRNAQVVLHIQEQYGSLDAYLWRYVGGQPLQNAWKSPSQIPNSTHESDLLSKDLKMLGMSFVGSTICYAFMQAVGMVNDHIVDCFRYAELMIPGG